MDKLHRYMISKVPKAYMENYKNGKHGEKDSYNETISSSKAH